nr:hypothetical protein [Klebsiella pneumoniae]
MASWGSYVFELCRINANQGLTAEMDWNYTCYRRLPPQKIIPAHTYTGRF